MEVRNLVKNYVDFLTFKDLDEILNNFLNFIIKDQILINKIMKNKTISIMGHYIEINFKINAKDHYVVLTDFVISSSLLNTKNRNQANFAYRSYMLKKLDLLNMKIAKMYRLELFEILHKEMENETLDKTLQLEKQLAEISNL